MEKTLNQLEHLGLVKGGKIGNEIIESVFAPKNYDIIVLKTSSKIHFRNYQNQPIETSDHWTDFYIEPITNSFFRKDQNDFWYDLEGHRLSTPIFLMDDVLISLLEKTSKQSLSFRYQEIISSPHFGLVQVGKLVFDAKLNLVDFYGERITGLGRKNIVFQSGKIVQEVEVGLQKKVFIDEEKRTPFLINEEIVTKHLQTLKKQKNHFEIFLTEESEYVLLSKTSEPLKCDDCLVSIDFSTYVKFGKEELVYSELDDFGKYMDINSQSTFQLDGLENEPIIFIDSNIVQVNGDLLRNVKTEKKAFVFNETQQKVFTLNEGEIMPNSVKDLANFENHFAVFSFENNLDVFSKKKLKVIDIQGFTGFLQNINSSPDQPLWNALDGNSQKIVIDARQGFDHLKIAKIDHQNIVKVFDSSHKIGNSFLQNALLKTLGGTEKRVIDLTKDELKIYTLPDDLKSNPINDEHSVYKNSPIHELDFSNPITIEEEEFLVGKFIPFREEISPIIIQKSNNRPLQFEGSNHKNEIVTAFNFKTLETKFFLGKHRMIGAFTLTENYKKEELIFSFQEQKSSLRFGEEFLPIFKKIVPIENEKGWTCSLFEIRNTTPKSEFVAVESHPPYRILVRQKGGKSELKLFKGSDKLPKTPEDVSMMSRWFFGNPGVLKDL